MVAEGWAEWPLANVDGLTVTRHKHAGWQGACPVDSPPLGWLEACWSIRHRHRLPLVVVARMPCGSMRCCYPARTVAASPSLTYVFWSSFRYRSVADTPMTSRRTGMRPT